MPQTTDFTGDWRRVQFRHPRNRTGSRSQFRLWSGLRRCSQPRSRHAENRRSQFDSACRCRHAVSVAGAGCRQCPDRHSQAIQPDPQHGIAEGKCTGGGLCRSSNRLQSDEGQAWPRKRPRSTKLCCEPAAIDQIHKLQRAGKTVRLLAGKPLSGDFHDQHRIRQEW